MSRISPDEYWDIYDMLKEYFPNDTRERLKIRVEEYLKKIEEKKKVEKE